MCNEAVQKELDQIADKLGGVKDRELIAALKEINLKNEEIIRLLREQIQELRVGSNPALVPPIDLRPFYNNEPPRGIFDRWVQTTGPTSAPLPVSGVDSEPRIVSPLKLTTAENS